MPVIANLVTQQGLGDLIVSAGAAVYLSELYDRIQVFCFRKYLPSVCSFYVDHPKVRVIPIENENEILETPADVVLKTGWSAGKDPTPKESWDQWFYRQLDIPFATRWTHCPIEAASKKVKQRNWPLRTALVHDDQSRDCTITQLPQTFLRVKEDGQSILNLASAIQSAPALHVIDSAIFHLIECLQPRGDLYLHRYARTCKPVWQECQMRHPWKIIY